MFGTRALLTSGFALPHTHTQFQPILMQPTRLRLVFLRRQLSRRDCVLLQADPIAPIHLQPNSKTLYSNCVN